MWATATPSVAGVDGKNVKKEPRMDANEHEGERLIEKQRAKLSVYDRVKHLIGEVHGPPDLSTNLRYLLGFGEDLRPFGAE
jgi:hypothetical protein